MSGTRRSGHRSQGYLGIVVHRPNTPTNVDTLRRSAFLYQQHSSAASGARYQREEARGASRPVRHRTRMSWIAANTGGPPTRSPNAKTTSPGQTSTAATAAPIRPAGLPKLGRSAMTDDTPRGEVSVVAARHADSSVVAPPAGGPPDHQAESAPPPHDGVPAESPADGSTAEPQPGNNDRREPVTDEARVVGSREVNKRAELADQARRHDPRVKDAWDQLKRALERYPENQDALESAKATRDEELAGDALEVVGVAAVRCFVEHVDPARIEAELPWAPDFAFDGRSTFAAGALR
jgi:hypothetical protein